MHVGTEKKGNKKTHVFNLSRSARRQAGMGEEEGGAVRDGLEGR